MRHAIYTTAIIGLLLAGCASGPDPETRTTDSAPAAARADYPAITLTQEAATLGDTVREIGASFPGGIVVMSGIQEKGLAPLAWMRKPYDAAVREIATETESDVGFRAGYYFLYPAGYEALLDYRLAERVPEDYAAPRLAVNIGAGTALYDAFSLLSFHTGKTIIASNAIAEERCGEIALGAVSPINAIEALLQSARIPEAQLRISATADYLFVDASIATPRGPFRMGATGTQDDEALLATRITATLPAPPQPGEGFPFYGAPLPLGTMLVALSAQSGIRVACDPALINVPVNPCTFSGLPLATALDLLLRQWPVGGFGYEARGGSVYIRAAN